MQNKFYQKWLEENKTDIEYALADAAYSFLQSQCNEFEVNERIDFNDVRNGTGGQMINLGQARATKDKDRCEYITDGITSYNGVPSILVTFRCWQGGGDTRVFNGVHVVKDLWEQYKSDKKKDIAKKANKTYYQQYRAPSKKKNTPKKSFGLKILRKEIELWHKLERSGESQYLIKKGFTPDQNGLFHESAYGCRFGKDKFGQTFIALPITSINGKIKGLQKIYDNPDIGKRFTYNLQKKGNFILIGGNLENFEGRAIRVVEGYTTGLTVNLATNDLVVCALDAGNILSVCQNIRFKYKKKYILIHGDNDKWKEKEINPMTGKQKINTGVTKAMEASKLVQATFCNFPSFSDSLALSKPTDYNDLYLLEGMEEVKKQLHYDLPIEPRPIKFYSPQEAQKILNKHISEYIQHGTSKAIALTTGAGKTQAIIDNIYKFKKLEIYEPTHAKCEEVATDIRKASDGKISVHVPKGRSFKDENGIPMCQKHEVAEKLASMGQRVYVHMCHDGEKKCEFIGENAFDSNGKLSSPSCPWVKQWLQKTDVRVIPHSYLQINRSSLESISFMPEHIVIDESFHKNLLKSYRIPLLDLIESPIDRNIKHAITRALRDKLPLLKTMREQGISNEDVEDQLQQIGNESNNVPITPDMDADQQISIINAIKEKSKFKGLLKAILKEITINRDECISVEYLIKDKVEYIQVYYMKEIKRFDSDLMKGMKVFEILEKNGKISKEELIIKSGLSFNTVNSIINSLKRNDMLIKTIFDRESMLSLAIGYEKNLKTFKQDCYIPVLILDADADEKIVGKCVPHKIENVEIHCQDNLYVTQLSSASVSATSLKRNSDLYLKVAANWAKSRIKEGKKVKIGGAQAYTGNASKGIKPSKIFSELGDSVSFTHFNGLRGLNTFKGFDAGITIGRNQPPVYAVEAQAKAMYADDPEPLILIGNSPMPRVKVEYRMRDKSLRWAEVERHPDPRVQSLLSQIRESEIRQDIGRLRTTHHQGESKEYFIITNLPLPTIIVDELVTTKECLRDTYTSKTDRLVNHFFLKKDATRVMPISDPHALVKASEGVVDFTSLEAARKLGQRIIGHDIIRNLLSSFQFSFSPKTISYRIDGQKGKSSKAIIACSYEEAKQKLENLVGKMVTIEEMIEHKVSDPFFNLLNSIYDENELLDLVNETVFLCKDDDLMFTLLDNIGKHLSVLKHIVIEHVLERTGICNKLLN